MLNSRTRGCVRARDPGSVLRAQCERVRSWQKVQIALDATYSLDRNLSGVGVYSREVLFGLARSHPKDRFQFCYRPHRFLRSFRDPLPGNTARRILRGAPRADLFHALNQRVDAPARCTVTTFHDLFVITGEYSTPEFRARFAQQARQAARRTDLMIAVSRFTAQQIEEFLGVESSRIRVIPHGVRVPSEGPTALRENLVLFVGAIQRRKNVARLVRAFERMPASWRLVLAGAADGFGAAEELHAVESSPRKSDIDVLGYVTQIELEALYRRARIFAFPSLDEGFGMPVLDAMANSVPVITSRRSALPEVAGDAALLVNPEDPEEIAAALVLLASEEGLCEDLARRGRERALQFSWDSALTKTWEVYREITGATAPPD
ncbi:MAG: glycosyl transferase, group 1 [Bryobacterales bacterium]|nr:glycosyl transferase, group 1 [Bryobacterales bacterium]